MLPIGMAWGIFVIVAVATLITSYLWGKGKALDLKAALKQTAFFVAVAIMFGVVVYFAKGGTGLGQYYTGYALENSLSTDNLMVFALLLGYFQIPAAREPKILSIGIACAMLFRAAALLGGFAVLHYLSWGLYAMGGLLLLLAARMLKGSIEGLKSDGDDEELPKVVFWLERKGYSVLSAVIAAFVACDLIFAVDSVPTILGLVQDKFIATSASLMAVMGLRALYFVLRAVENKFYLLPLAISTVLLGIGIKLVLPLVHVEIGTITSLVVTLGLLAAGMSASVIFPKKVAVADGGTPQADAS